MPELPEVETLRRSLLPLVKNKVCSAVKFFRKDLRFPIPQESLMKGLTNTKVQDISRQGKYLLFHVPKGFMLMHLGMSGRVTLQSTVVHKKNIRMPFLGFQKKTTYTLSILDVSAAFHGCHYLANTR